MIIAEIGQNFCGDMALAKRLIDFAMGNGANYAKFQLYDHDKLYKGMDIHDSSLTFSQAKKLFDYGQSIGMKVFFSVFDLERVGWCEEIGVTLYKVAYSQRNNHELIRAMENTRKPVLVSGRDLYCIPHYPTEPKELDFCELGRYKGYSDHTIGLDCAKIALAKGAGIVEKHFAVCHNKGVDALWSMTPDELRELAEWERLCLLTS